MTTTIYTDINEITKQQLYQRRYKYKTTQNHMRQAMMRLTSDITINTNTNDN